MKRCSIVLMSVMVCLAMATPASAQIFPFTALMTGFQQVPPNGSPGIGMASGNYDAGTGQLSWDIAWVGLLAPETAMHFHGPAPAGVNAGVQVDIAGISGLVSPSIGSAIISAAQATDLQSNLWYINLHTTAFPGGEIRGQVMVVPEPSTLALIGLAGVAVLKRGRRRRRR